MSITFGRPSLDIIIERQKRDRVTQIVTTGLLRSSPLLQLLPFLSDVQASARSRRITYSYTRQNNERVAQVRDWNTDYRPAYSGKGTEHTAVLRPIGDAFEIDRAFGDADPEYIDEELVKMSHAISSKFADLFINGDSAANSIEFDGLAKVANKESGLSLTMGTGSSADMLTFRQNLARISKAVRTMKTLGLEPVVLGNADSLASLELGGDVLGYGEKKADYYGQNQVSSLAGAPLIDVGMTTALEDKGGAATGTYDTKGAEIIPTVGGTTDLYVVGLSATRGVCGLTLNGNGASPVQYQTSERDAGAIRRYEMELIAGVAILDDRAVVHFEDVRL